MNEDIANEFEEKLKKMFFLQSIKKKTIYYVACNEKIHSFKDQNLADQFLFSLLAEQKLSNIHVYVASY